MIDSKAGSGASRRELLGLGLGAGAASLLGGLNAAQAQSRPLVPPQKPRGPGKCGLSA